MAIVHTSAAATILKIHITALEGGSIRSAILSLDNITELVFAGRRHTVTCGWDRAVFIALLSRWPLKVFRMGVVYGLPGDDILSKCRHGAWVGTLVHGIFNCDILDMGGEPLSFQHLRILCFSVPQSNHLSVTTVSKLLLHCKHLQQLNFPRNLCADEWSDLSKDGIAEQSKIATMIVIASQAEILTPCLTSGELLHLLRIAYASQMLVVDPRWKRMPNPDDDLEGALRSNMWLAPTAYEVDEVRS